ncbi:hypothetical protein BGX24_008143, partial [Mortierella sp. AD032]
DSMAPCRKAVEAAPNVASSSLANHTNMGVVTGATLVEGAMHALHIAPVESGQNGLAEMDLDIDIDALEDNEEFVEPTPIKAEEAREQINCLGKLFREKMSKKMALRARMLGAGEKMADADEQRLQILDSKIDVLRKDTD